MLIMPTTCLCCTISSRDSHTSDVIVKGSLSLVLIGYLVSVLNNGKGILSNKFSHWLSLCLRLMFSPAPQKIWWFRSTQYIYESILFCLNLPDFACCLWLKIQILLTLPLCFQKILLQNISKIWMSRVVDKNLKNLTK